MTTKKRDLGELVGMKVLRDCETAVLGVVPPITKAVVPPSALEYCRSKYSGEVLFALRREGEVFLQRKTWYPPGVHRIAGGGIEKDEDPSAALRRELYEETGLALEALDYKLLTLLVYNGDFGEGAFVSHLFEVNLTHGAQVKAGPAPDEGFEGWEAFNEEEIQNMISILNEGTCGNADWGAFRAVALKAYLTYRTHNFRQV